MSTKELNERVLNPEIPPLTKIRILDLSQAIAGPMAAMYCGDFGAEVIKVEPPGGDLARQLPPFADDISTYFASANRNKESICLDNKSTEGRNILTKLLAYSDVVIVNNPSLESLERQNFDIESLSKINPSIIEVAVSLFGHTGPLEGTPGYDYNIQAFTGAMSLTGDPNDDQPWRFPGPYVDVLTAQAAFTQIVLALYRRDHSSIPFAQFIDQSLLNSSTAVLFNALSEAATFDKDASKEGNLYPYIEPYRLYRAKDGWIVVAIGSNNNWKGLCRLFEEQNISSLHDDNFRDNRNRVYHRQELHSILEPFMEGKTITELEQLFIKHRVVAQKVQTVAEFLHHPQTIAREVMVSLTDAKGNTVIVPNNPWAASNMPMVKPTFPPKVNEHMERVLERLQI